VRCCKLEESFRIEQAVIQLRGTKTFNILVREDAMKRLILAAATAIGLSYATDLQAQTGDRMPPIAGGYTNVTAIPVNDPAIKAISAALFKPAGPGPFPAVVYMIGCGGIDSPPIRAQQKAAIDHMLAKGLAILIVDSFTPRNEPEGVCAKLDGEKVAFQYATRGSNDALAAVAALKAMPEIDAKHVFLVGFSLGGISSLLAVDSKNPASRDSGVAGVVAYYPLCYDGVDPSVRALVLIGEKDDWTPAAKCQAVTGKTDFEVVVFPSATHVFNMPTEKPLDYLGHHFVYDEKATQAAQERADAFMTEQKK
jgi:dienelactone hydrolase